MALLSLYKYLDTLYWPGHPPPLISELRDPSNGADIFLESWLTRNDIWWIVDLAFAVLTCDRAASKFSYIYWAEAGTIKSIWPWVVGENNSNRKSVGELYFPSTILKVRVPLPPPSLLARPHPGHPLSTGTSFTFIFVASTHHSLHMARGTSIIAAGEGDWRYGKSWLLFG